MTFAVLCVCCGGTPTDPSNPFGDPTPRLFPLPSNAPAEAAAPRETTRVTITFAQILDSGGRQISPDSLIATVRYVHRIWVFCPEGLEGNIEVRTRVTGGEISEPLTLIPGYSFEDVPVSFLLPGSYPFNTRLLKGFVTIASKDLTITVR